MFTSPNKNCILCVNVFVDPPGLLPAFIASLNLIQEGGWVMFNIAKTSYDNYSNPPEFVKFYRQAIAEGTLKLENTHVYNHRRFFNGQTLEYVAILARKQS